MQEYLAKEGFITCRNSRLEKTLHRFCENEIAGLNNEGHEGVLAPAKTVPNKNDTKYNYLDAVRDGSMTLLRALAVSF